jgi:glucosamine--fructose-6-phosphate aminotransferase (isomerizing)
VCGIVGYIGSKTAVPILIDGIKKLEYRGYDSAGIALNIDVKLKVFKSRCKIVALEEQIADFSLPNTVGIAHTRWATHGEPSTKNAHPHTDCTGSIIVVHNGIIENYRSLRKYLEVRGHIFTTDTDTEIIAHLIEDIHKTEADFMEAIRLSLLQLEGTYGLGIMHKDIPGSLFCARHGSPLIIGIGQNENFIASDPAAVLRYTKSVVYLEEGELAEVTKNDFRVINLHNKKIEPIVEKLALDLQQIEKGGFRHFMLKEIFEQPTTLINAMRGRLNIDEGTTRLNGLKNYLGLLKDIDRIVITACGTSWHSALIGEYLIEELARIPVEVEYASEFRYRSPILDNRTAVFVISQSGETADTLAALREAKRKGSPVFGIVNVVGSTIARETDAGLFLYMQDLKLVLLQQKHLPHRCSV